MNTFPSEILHCIYEYDATYKEIYTKVMVDLQTKMMWYWCNQNVIRDSYASCPVVASDFYIQEFINWRERTFSKWYFDKFRYFDKGCTY